MVDKLSKGCIRQPLRISIAQACSRMSLYCVPLYDSLGENAIEFIINHSESTIVFVASDKMANLAAALPHVKELVKTVVYWDAGNQSAAEVRQS